MPPDIRPYWTVNPFAWWCHDERPIAYRVDGFHIWSGNSLRRPFIATFGQDLIEDYDYGVVHFATLEGAMTMVDEQFPSGRRVRDPAFRAPRTALWQNHFLRPASPLALSEGQKSLESPAPPRSRQSAKTRCSLSHSLAASGRERRKRSRTNP